MQRCFVMFFLLLFLSSLLLAEAPQEQVSAEKKLQIIQTELKKNQQELLKTRKEEQEVLGRLVVINKELKKTKETLSRAQKKIQVNEVQVGALSTELSLRENDLARKEDKFKRRIVEMYKSSGLNYLELLVASHSMSDFFNRLYFFRRVAESDTTLVQGVREDVQQVKQKKGVLEKKTNEIRTLAAEVAEKKKEISLQADEKKNLYSALQRRRIEYEERIAELEKSSAELETLILKKVGGRRTGKYYGSGIFDWPLQGRLTSYFGYRRSPFWGRRSMHTGLDIAAKYGSPIKAADAGEVIFAGWWDGYGKAIVIDHGRHLTTVYAHLSRIYRQAGSVVEKGQIIGLEGSTGYSTGPHLHFEVRKDGKPMDPLKYLK
jgi:murein DD-endopeptidase MepM/ murein hydrolase activator NlpD